MMKELVDLVVKKTGIKADQAKIIVELVLDFLKKKLPKPVAAQIDAVMASNVDLNAAANVVGGLLGGKKK
jgi:nucleoid DNA-binding protein